MKTNDLSKNIAAYIRPEIEIVPLNNTDVITASGGGQPVDYQDDRKWETPKIFF